MIEAVKNLKDFDGLPVRWVRSSRRTLALILHPDGSLEIRSPHRATETRITAFLQTKTDWIRKKRSETASITQVSREHLEPKDDVAFRDLVSGLVTRYSGTAVLAGIQPKRLSFRSQRSRWGSCSAKGCLSFNYACARLPLELIEYIVAHEMCHLVRMDHSPAFRALLRSVLPEADHRRKILARYRFADRPDSEEASLYATIRSSLPFLSSFPGF